MEVKTPESIVMDMCLNEIEVAEYQRGVSLVKVRNIVSHFNPNAVGLLLLSYRDDRYWIVDGQHRLMALLKLGATKWKCEVFVDLNYQQEARMFRDRNTSKKPTPANRFVADLEANDPRAIAIKNIVESEGYNISFNQKNGNYAIAAISSLEQIHENYGGQMLRRVLKVIKKTWNGEKDSLREFFILGFAEFFKRYTNEFDEDALIKKLSITPLYAITRKTMDNSRIFKELPRISFARTVVDVYNKGRRTRHLENKFAAR